MFPLFDILGYYGPTFMIFVNLWEFRYRLFHILLFVIYLFFTIWITKELKMSIRQPRPYGYNDEAYSEWMNWMEYSGAEQYGMPSGHSTLMFFSLFYLWWMKTSAWYMIGGSFLAILTVIQRFRYKKHTIEQLVVGAFLGIGLSYVAYITTTVWFSKMNGISKSPDNV